VDPGRRMIRSTCRRMCGRSGGEMFVRAGQRVRHKEQLGYGSKSVRLHHPSHLAGDSHMTRRGRRESEHHSPMQCLG
jgi:hypothetical protein